MALSSQARKRKSRDGLCYLGGNAKIQTRHGPRCESGRLPAPRIAWIIMGRFCLRLNFASDERDPELPPVLPQERASPGYRDQNPTQNELVDHPQQLSYMGVPGNFRCPASGDGIPHDDGGNGRRDSYVAGYGSPPTQRPEKLPHPWPGELEFSSHVAPLNCLWVITKRDVDRFSISARREVQTRRDIARSVAALRLSMMTALRARAGA